jgi:predicted transcriptional regulator
LAAHSADASPHDWIAGRLDTIESKIEALRAAITSRRKDYYTVEEVSRIVGRSAFTVRRWISECQRAPKLGHFGAPSN